MKLFKKNINDVTIPDKAATCISNGILKSQCWFANNLERLTKKWRKKQQRVFLYSLCLLFGGLSTAAIINSFKVSEKTKAIIPKSISIPKSITTENEAFIITENEFKKVQEYKQAHPNLIKEKPGLYDSLTLIEQSYYSQNK